MKAVSRSERIRLQLLFGLFGVGLMAMAPRSPDLKHNLGVNNGLYGFLVSLGAIGSVVSLLYIGRLVQRFSIRSTLYVTGTALYGLIAAIPHIHTPWMYAVINIFLALSFSAHNIALHSQTLQRQDETGELLLARMHGSWSIGVLITVTSALALTSHIPFAVHIDVLIGCVWALTMILIRLSEKDFISKSGGVVEMEKLNFARIKRIFTFDKSIILAYSLGTFIEYSSGDWSTLVANQEIHASKSSSILAYLALILGMILGRMYFVKLIGYRSEQFWISLAAYGGGGGFIFFTQLAWYLAKHHSSLALPSVVLAFAMAGLGTSFMAPLFTTIANRRSALKPSEVVSQLNLANTIVVFFAKMVVAWVVQATSITIALLIPGIALIFVSQLARLGNSKPLKSL